MQPADLAACDELRRLAGWNQPIADCQRFLALAPAGCFVAEQDTRVLGTVTTVSYQRDVGWIGMLLVHPETRGQGIGKALLTRAIEHLRSESLHCIKLDATPKGEPLYRKIGFNPEWMLTRFETRELKMHLTSAAREMRVGDLPSIIPLDQEAFGADRSELLRSLHTSARSARVIEEHGRVIGFGILRSGSTADYLGPIVADSAGSAEQLVSSLSAASAGRTFYWDVPKTNLAATNLAQKLGFEVQRPLLRMFLGSQNQTGNVKHYFGLADPALG